MPYSSDLFFLFFPQNICAPLHYLLKYFYCLVTKITDLFTSPPPIVTMVLVYRRTNENPPKTSGYI